MSRDRDSRIFLSIDHILLERREHFGNRHRRRVRAERAPDRQMDGVLHRLHDHVEAEIIRLDAEDGDDRQQDRRQIQDHRRKSMSPVFVSYGLSVETFTALSNCATIQLHRVVATAQGWPPER